jgi:hypothetical protein
MVSAVTVAPDVKGFLQDSQDCGLFRQSRWHRFPRSPVSKVLSSLVKGSTIAKCDLYTIMNCVDTMLERLEGVSVTDGNW